MEDTNNQIAFNIMDLNNLKDIWDKLKNVYIKIDQGIVYSIFQQLFNNYLKVNKSKKYDK